MDNPGNLSEDPAEVVLDPNYKYSYAEQKEIMNARAQYLWDKDHKKGTKKGK